MLYMRQCRKRLTVVWLIATGVLFLVLILQTVLGRYDEPDEAFSWLLPTIIPTLSLVLGVLVSDLTDGGEPDRRVDGFMYKLAYTISIAYFVVVSLTIFLAPFSSMAPVELMKTSNLWLSPLQGVVAAVIGVFFVRKSPKPSPDLNRE